MVILPWDAQQHSRCATGVENEHGAAAPWCAGGRTRWWNDRPRSGRHERGTRPALDGERPRVLDRAKCRRHGNILSLQASTPTAVNTRPDPAGLGVPPVLKRLRTACSPLPKPPETKRVHAYRFDSLAPVRGAVKSKLGKPAGRRNSVATAFRRSPVCTWSPEKFQILTARLGADRKA